MVLPKRIALRARIGFPDLEQSMLLCSDQKIILAFQDFSPLADSLLSPCLRLLGNAFFFYPKWLPSAADPSHQISAPGTIDFLISTLLSAYPLVSATQ